MSRSPEDSLAVLAGLFKEFPSEAFPIVHLLASSDVPQPYNDLLNHEHHMTVTMESHYHEAVGVRVLTEVIRDNSYARTLNLYGENTGKVVLFGLMRVRMDFLPRPVQIEILARKQPLGRILIQHQIMRQIELIKLLKIESFPNRESWFNLKDQLPYYGRVAMIHCQGQPAIELFEVVRPNA